MERSVSGQENHWVGFIARPTRADLITKSFLFKKGGN